MSCFRFAAVCAAGSAFAASALAGTQVWNFDEDSSGRDVMWISPTAVNPDASSYSATYTLDQVLVDVSFGPLSFNDIDVTDEIPPEFQTGEGMSDGPAPLTLIDGMLAFPEPPEPAGFAATVSVGLDANGFGFFNATDITLDQVDLAIPGFGTVTVDVNAVRVVGTVSITPSDDTNPADLDGDNTVNGADLLLLLNSWGPCPKGEPCPADVDGNGIVSGSDLLLLLSLWG